MKGALGAAEKKVVVEATGQVQMAREDKVAARTEAEAVKMGAEMGMMRVVARVAVPAAARVATMAASRVAMEDAPAAAMGVLTVVMAVEAVTMAAGKTAYPICPPCT